MVMHVKILSFAIIFLLTGNCFGAVYYNRQFSTRLSIYIYLTNDH